ncbi:MAG: ABC transporter ATP-binding protein [Methylobacteriaceae bacterium]|nr:ABC transporter ATP-binding protein [Methylobacteriaceae bacterium]
MSSIEIEGVDLHYGGPAGARAATGILALSQASLSIRQGEFTAIVGPSGCGKSTLLKLVAGLVRPTRGSVKVNGEDVMRPLKRVGMAFQNATLLPWRTIRDNVLLPLEIVEPFRSQQRRQRTEHRERADMLLKSVGLAGFGSRMPWELSGGMQQRAQLCRALVHEPAILLLDEPFGALDAFTREELWGVLQALWIERQFTVILVTHELREAGYLADKVHVMSARPGKVTATYPVPLARPRSLETTFAPEFVALVHELRGNIGQAAA